jgi:uncharacterized damage-inducible protein DinB
MVPHSDSLGWASRLGGDWMDLLDRLLEHDRWATAHLLELCRGLTDAQLDQPFDIGHRTLRATLDHQIPNLDFWTGLMTGQPVEHQRGPSSLDTLIADHERAYAAFAILARRVRDEGRLDDTFLDHYGYPMTYGGAILMVILHNEAHRTEVVHIFARLGVSELAQIEVDHGLWDFKRRGVTAAGEL